MAFIFEYVPSTPTLVGVSIMNGCWILSLLFFKIYWDDHVGFDFCFLIWYITLTCTCWLILLNLGWSWCIIFFLCVEFGLLIYLFIYLFRIFMHIVFQRYWPGIVFSGGIFVWFGDQHDGGLHRLLWEYSLLFNLL